MATERFAQKIQKLLPTIKERREEIEEARQLPKDLVQDLIETGVFKLGILADYGGDQVDAVDYMRAVETISAADGSVGWTVMIGAGAGPMSGMMRDEGAKEVFADPSQPKGAAVPPQGAAVKVDGGFKVNGRYRFVSGITHSDWVMVGNVVLYDGQPRMTPMGMPEFVWTWIPAAEIEIHDTWYVNGLRGTGSNDISVTDVFVPEHRTLHMFDPTNHRPEPVVRMPGVAGFAGQVATVGVGIARAALDELAELATTKMPSMSQTPLLEKATAQIEIAQMEAQLGGARSYLYDTIDDLWQTVLAGGEPTLKQIAASRVASVQAADTAARITQRVNTIAGSSSLYLSSSLQRHARDADAVTHHFVVSPPTWEDAGRVFLGLNPKSPLF